MTERLNAAGEFHRKATSICNQTLSLDAAYETLAADLATVQQRLAVVERERDEAQLSAAWLGMRIGREAFDRILGDRKLDALSDAIAAGVARVQATEEET